ncbi:MAG: four-carbon acid sugar kinase family protein [Casimicrobium sp.]
MKIRVVTDDFTSASDGIAAFTDKGWSCAVAFSRGDTDAVDVASCDTDSRTLSEFDAAARVAEWASAWRDANPLIKQFDSTLRGPIAAELRSAWQASARAKLVIAPAFPDAGRVLREGIVYVHGQPVSQTAFAVDPLNPVKQSNLRELLRESGIAARVCLPHRIVEALNDNDAVIVDAQTEADLDVIASTYMRNVDALWCGSTGLVRAFARTLPAARSGKEPLKLEIPQARNTWVCIGSLNPVSREQKTFLSAIPIDGIRILATDDDRGAAHRQIDELASRVASAVRSGECDSLIATGGETAKHIANALNAKRLHVMREMAPGIPLCLLELEERSLPFITKAGGFGTASSLYDLSKAMQEATQ